MPRRFPRICPLCDKPGVANLSSHLEIVYDICGVRRSQLLKEAKVSWGIKSQSNPTNALPHCRQLHIDTCKKRTSAPRKRPISMKETPKTAAKRPKLTHEATEPYPEFMFRHKFSLLVVGPSQSGKTVFVEQILTTDRILYETNKPLRILWYYSQWQDRYEAMKSAIGRDIEFLRGFPNFREDLREIDPKYNNVIIFDDLMAEAIESSIVSRLFTQGHHRNASFILLLQNMFTKGKFSSDISRNAQYGSFPKS